MRNNSGKALAIFLVVIAVLLVSLTAISVFFFIQEMRLRETAEYNLEQKAIAEQSLRKELADIEKAKEILEKKLKESETKIEDILEELDVVEGVREEIKKENRDLQAALNELKNTRKQLKDEMDNTVASLEERAAQLQQELDKALEENQNIQQKYQDLQQEYDEFKTRTEEQSGSGAAAQMDDVDLKKIVVNPEEGLRGSVISVDTEANFVIVDLGEQHGITPDTVLTVTREGGAVGEVKVTRVLPEMSAADLVSPLTGQGIAEGDEVILPQ
ncbi:MAG: hypothetical protein ACLFPX_00620 [Candidatus Omnitrophota bacterium]